MRCANLAVVTLLCLLAAFWAVAGEPVPELRVDAAAGVPPVRLLQGDRVLLQSAGGGALVRRVGLRDGWPADWRHAAPQSVEKAGEWTILRGNWTRAAGVARLSDAYRMEKGLVRCNRRFEWHGGETLEKCTLSVRFEAPGGGRGRCCRGALPRQPLRRGQQPGAGLHRRGGRGVPFRGAPFPHALRLLRMAFGRRPPRRGPPHPALPRAIRERP